MECAEEKQGNGRVESMEEEWLDWLEGFHGRIEEAHQSGDGAALREMAEELKDRSSKMTTIAEQATELIVSVEATMNRVEKLFDLACALIYREAAEERLSKGLAELDWEIADIREQCEGFAA